MGKQELVKLFEIDRPQKAEAQASRGRKQFQGPTPAL